MFLAVLVERAQHEVRHVVDLRLLGRAPAVHVAAAAQVVLEVQHRGAHAGDRGHEPGHGYGDDRGHGPDHGHQTGQQGGLQQALGVQRLELADDQRGHGADRLLGRLDQLERGRLQHLGHVADAVRRVPHLGHVHHLFRLLFAAGRRDHRVPLVLLLLLLLMLRLRLLPLLLLRRAVHLVTVVRLFRHVDGQRRGHGQRCDRDRKPAEREGGRY